ncbi:hypothetical protein, partial [Roseateles sp. P5_E1]
MRISWKRINGTETRSMRPGQLGARRRCGSAEQKDEVEALHGSHFAEQAGPCHRPEEPCDEPRPMA